MNIFIEGGVLVEPNCKKSVVFKSHDSLDIFLDAQTDTQYIVAENSSFVEKQKICKKSQFFVKT